MHQKTVGNQIYGGRNVLNHENDVLLRKYCKKMPRIKKKHPKIEESTDDNRIFTSENQFYDINMANRDRKMKIMYFQTFCRA